MIVDKKVKLNLVGLDGNAFVVLGAFRRQARKERWTDNEIDMVLDAAQSGDYENLLNVISAHCDME